MRQMGTTSDNPRQKPSRVTIIPENNEIQFHHSRNRFRTISSTRSRRPDPKKSLLPAILGTEWAESDKVVSIGRWSTETMEII